MSTPLLMITASTRPTDDEPGVCLAMRFGRIRDLSRLEGLMIRQVRTRYPGFLSKAPTEVREELKFDLWEVPLNPSRGGWPRFLGPLEHYT